MRLKFGLKVCIIKIKVFFKIKLKNTYGILIEINLDNLKVFTLVLGCHSDLLSTASNDCFKFCGLILQLIPIRPSLSGEVRQPRLQPLFYKII